MPVNLNRPLRRLFQIRKSKLVFAYLAILLIPYVATFSLNIDYKGLYSATLVFLNTVAMMAFFVQFPLAGRFKHLPVFSNIDWSMSKHKTAGKWIGFFFLLHPVLILAPRFLVSFDDGMTSLVEAITSPQLLTGLIAWVVMILWILLAIFKDRLRISYETWHLTHLLGFVVICVLASLHVTSVGRHGQFDEHFNMLWWGLCAMSMGLVLFNQLVKKNNLKKSPFTLVSITRGSSRDWLVRLRNDSPKDFSFEAGQFIWINTSGSAHSMNEHPFSIASSSNELPEIRLVIREQGDYTSQLDRLTIGQKVYVDGPYGSMSLRDSESARGITLIAGGAGIGPMLSLLRELAANHDPRPVRLLYGNKDYEQMVLQDEIQLLQHTMPDFTQQLVCDNPTNIPGVRQGVIGKDVIAEAIDPELANDWAVYLCGPPAMIAAVTANLRSLGIPEANIHYEYLSF
ncbi:ferric reductase-like transmembrane domain-containing protein [Marinobacter sp. ANT_B65]|uniref:ferredoxin reductase family protein n=1 Tax=Marinobacter sp. ANT_B65 TaxID=2039467 RepID=UPI0015C87E2A|nr:ferric reductase-like transmembrane domain-containing protein [Marinobacter sp. ANT_B65]